MTVTRSMRRIAAGFLVSALASASEAQSPANAVDWSAFLGRHDMVWDRLPQGWGESVFVGNGITGATVDRQDTGFGWTINRTDVTPQQSRFPIGRLVLKTSGALRGGSARLTLWDAEGSGTVLTDRGSVRWRAYVPRSPSVVVIEVTGEGGEAGADLEWVPAEARPPRNVLRNEPFAPGDLHPPATIERTATELTSVQRFLSGEVHAESIRRQSGPGATKRFYVGIGWDSTGKTALSEARALTSAATARGEARLRTEHRAWWHAFYPSSFLSFPDARLEGYYWINTYKLGAAMREDGPILDLAGPWFRGTPWPRIWWNLNIQLTYSPLFRANRLPLAESLFRNLDRRTPALIRNVPERLRGEAAAIGRSSGPDLVRSVNLTTAQSDAAKEMGNLPWTMYYYWQFYRYQMDDAILRNRVYPLLSRAIGNYLGYVEKGADGKWHLPATHSPELASLPDANYDLALLKWGLQTLVATAERLKIAESRLARWRDVLANLTPFPADSTGLLVGRDRPWRESHRHYSHLMAIYPLGLLRPDRPEERALIERSLRTWESQPQLFRGYSFTGGAAMHAMLGNGDSALVRMNRYLDAPRYMEANTFYAEAGPVIETPFAAVATLQEMVLQDWGGAVRVFPGVPTAWSDVSFDRLRTEGAFLVSAVRRGGKTAWVKVQSLAGQPLRVVVPDWDAAVVRSHAGSAPRVTRSRAGELTIQLARGSSVVLAPTATSPLPSLAPVALPSASRRHWPALKPDTAKRTTQVRPQDAPALAWWRSSMETRDERIKWFREVKFGMFVHWGAYSHLAGVWQGTPVRGYAEHIQRMRKIPQAVYRAEVVEKFNPTKFDADEWMRIAKRAGMGYFVITAKHHDGFAIYDSDVSTYDIVDATPFKRDPMRELRDAARRHGLKFGFYYSHAFDWGEPDAPGNDWEYRNPGGDLLLHGRDWWLSRPELVDSVRRYVDRKAIPQIRELVRKYDPDIMWFDTPHKLPLEENLRILRATREAKPSIVINGRGTQAVPGGPEARFGDYANTADRPAEIYPHAGEWEAIPTTNESYGHHLMDSSHKSPAHFVQLLAKAAARGGNLLLNIGPMGDGRVDPKDVAILDGVGAWMAKYGESIRGTARSPLPIQTWGRSTLRGTRLYLHVFDWPSDGRLHVAGLRSLANRAFLLANPDVAIPVKRVGPADVELQLPTVAPDPWNSVVVLEADLPMEIDPSFYLPANRGPIALHVFDGRLVNDSLRYGDGKRDRDVVLGWSAVDAGIDWTVRVSSPTRFAVAIEYATVRDSAGGRFVLNVGPQSIIGVVQPTGGELRFVTRPLGEVELPAGEHLIKVRATDIVGGELMRLRAVKLTPLPRVSR